MLNRLKPMISDVVIRKDPFDDDQIVYLVARRRLDGRYDIKEKSCDWNFLPEIPMLLPLIAKVTGKETVAADVARQKIASFNAEAQMETDWSRGRTVVRPATLTKLGLSTSPHI